MYIKTLKEALPFVSKANIPVMIWGKHGIGKSQSVKQFAEENDYHFTDIRLGTLEVGDFLGLSDFEKDSNNQSVATKFITPDWLKDVLTFCKKNPTKKAIIFLDEFNRARRDVLQASFQLVLDKRFHTHVLPDNCYIIAACNPNTEGYIVTDIADAALMDRFCHIKLEPSTDEWLDFASKRQFSTEIIDFIRDQRQLLQEKGEDFSLDEIKPSRRSWEMVNKLMKAETPANILQELCYGLVGHGATVAFVNHIKNADKPFTATQILKDYPKYKEKVVKFSELEDGGRTDILHSTGGNLKEHLEKLKETNKSLSDKEANNLIEFLYDVPSDISFNLGREFYMYESVRPHVDNATKLIEKWKGAKDGLAKVSKKKS